LDCCQRGLAVVGSDLDCFTGSCGRHDYWGPILVPKTVLSAELMRIFANQRCLLAMDDRTSTF
jgi:hypothetical protein